MSDWWRNFFDKDYLDIYGPVDAKKTAVEVKGIIKILRLRKGSRVLDLCCGYGRHSLGLAQKGFNVTGYDFSAVLLQKAKGDCKKKRMRLNLVRGGMREIPFEGKFDAVINMFTAFGYFEDESEDQKVINGICAALKTGGKLLLDTVNREWLMRVYQENDWEKVGNDFYALDERSFDPLTSRISAKTIILGGRKNIERHHSLRLYTLRELASMISRAKMELLSVYGHIDGRDYWIDTPRMIILAARK